MARLKPLGTLDLQQDDLPTRPHLQLFNNDPSESTEAHFHPFPDLPTELRLLIWNHALRWRRLLHFHLEEVKSTKYDDHCPRYALTNALGYPVTGDHYRVILKNRTPFLPELMRVNRESREAASAFYPVKLPCYLDSSAHGSGETLLSLNLEWDHVRIAAGPPWQDALVDFIHDLRAHDPNGLGLRNLVLYDDYTRDEGLEVYHGHNNSNNNNNNNNDDITSSKASEMVDATALAAFQATMRNLKSVWFMRVHPGGRALDVMTHTRVHVFNYGVPVFPAFTFFDAPARDPRDISQDLETVWGGMYDPRLGMLGWRRLLRNLGIEPRGLAPAVDIRFMVGSNLEDVAQSRVEASRRLHEEDFEWLMLQWHFLGWEGNAWNGNRPAGCFGTASGLQPKLPRFDGPGMLAAAPRPALGFWLFSADAFGEMQDDAAPREWLRIKGIFDLRGHWPDLAMAHVS